MVSLLRIRIQATILGGRPSSASTLIQPVIQVQTVTVNNSNGVQTYYVLVPQTNGTGQLSSAISASVISSQSESVSSAPPSTTSNSGNSEGLLAVGITDPPTVPIGVSAVYINYSQLQIHISGAGNQSGWKDVGTVSGQINLMSVLNVSQTIAVAKVTTGVFNALRFNITSVTVTYLGKNYSAFIINGHNMFTVPIDGRIQVSSATTATALVDLSPTVVLLSGQSGPGFLFTPEAVGYVVPSDQIPATSPGQQVGGRINLTNLKWWEKILEEQAKFAITGLALQPSSLTIQAVNGGNVSVLFSIAALSSQFSVNGGDSQLIAVSQMFVVEPNATLVAVNGVPLIRRF